MQVGTVLCVDLPLLDLKRRPEAMSPLDSQVLFGERLRVIEGLGDWLDVEHQADGYRGFVLRAGLKPAGPEPTHRIAARSSLLFSAPSIKAPSPTVLSFGACLTITVHEGRFAQTHDGRFAIGDHLLPLDQKLPDYVGTAELFLGVPYLWGGRSSQGLDCSGLVQLVLGAAGIAIPRDSGPQAQAFPKAYDWSPGKSRPQRGDLLFSPGHVALAVDEGQIIHANAGAMACTFEDLRGFEQRIKAREGSEISHAARPVAGK